MAKDNSYLYYEPPSDEVFEEVKAKSIDIWNTYNRPDQEEYRKEKIGRVEAMENVSDNLMVLCAMFDDRNQVILASKLSEGALFDIGGRIIAGGGNPAPFIPKKYQS